MGSYFFRLVAAKTVLGLARDDEFRQVADQLLDQGIYTPLADLIMFRHSDSPSRLFDRTLKHLGVEPFTEQAAIDVLVRHYVWSIAEGLFTPREGFRRFMEELYQPLQRDQWRPRRGLSDLGPLEHFYYSRQFKETVLGERDIGADGRQLHAQAFDRAATEFIEDWMESHCHAVIDPSWLEWHDGTVVRLAKTIRDDLAFDLLPVLGDALKDAGCTVPDLLAHCRHPGDHLRDCWVLDLLLGSE